MDLRKIQLMFSIMVEYKGKKMVVLIIISILRLYDYNRKFELETKLKQFDINYS